MLPPREQTEKSRQIAESEAALRAKPSPEAAFKFQRELIELNRVLLQIEDLVLDSRRDLEQSVPFMLVKESEKIPA